MLRFVETNPSADGDVGASATVYTDILSVRCIDDMNTSISQYASEFDVCNASEIFSSASTVLIFGGKGLSNADAQQNEYLNQMFIAELVHAPMFSLLEGIAIGIAALLVVVAAVVAAVVLAKRAKERRRSSMKDPLLMVRSASGHRVLEGYQQKLLIPYKRLKLHETIGSGASGQIYKGTMDGARVAVKELLSVLCDPDALTEFVNEAANLATLRHPNIVGFFGISKKLEPEGTRLLLVMELCDTSLHAVIRAADRRHRSLPRPSLDSSPLSLDHKAFSRSQAQMRDLKDHHPEFFFEDMPLRVAHVQKSVARLPRITQCASLACHVQNLTIIRFCCVCARCVWRDTGS